MKRPLAILAAAIAVFLWGFAFWGATALPYQTLQTAADDSAAQAALREYFPANGVYAVPSVNHDQEALEDAR